MAASIATRCAALERGLRLIKDGIPPYTAWQQTAREFGVTRSSLYRWFNRVQGHPRDEWPSLLEDQYKGRQLDPQTQPAWEFFLHAYRLTNPPNIRNAYEQTLTEAAKQGWGVPSEIGVRRRMDRERIRRRTRYDSE